MKTNMGKADRALRFIAGIFLLVAAFTIGFADSGWLHWAMIIVGAVLALTAAIGTCPLYTVFGIRTCRR